MKSPAVGRTEAEHPARPGSQGSSRPCPHRQLEKMDVMGLSLKSETRKIRPFVPPFAAADGGSSDPEQGRRNPGTIPGETDQGQIPEQGPRRHRARINRARVLDRSRLEEMVSGVQPQARFLAFVNLFLVLLPHRVDHVVSALDGEDREAACAAALSLASSAAMAGGLRLELVACLIDADLRAGLVNRARVTGRRLGPDAAELASALSPLLPGS
jgi:hypothetical protein